MSDDEKLDDVLREVRLEAEELEARLDVADEDEKERLRLRIRELEDRLDDLARYGIQADGEYTAGERAAGSTALYDDEVPCNDPFSKPENLNGFSLGHLDRTGEEYERKAHDQDVSDPDMRGTGFRLGLGFFIATAVVLGAYQCSNKKASGAEIYAPPPINATEK